MSTEKLVEVRSSKPRPEKGREHRLEIHHDLVILAKVFALAFAVGLDVLAISVGVGITLPARAASIKLGFAFAGSEIAMQLIGYELGTGVGIMLGEIAAYIGSALLAFIGVIRSSLHTETAAKFDATRGAGLLMTSLSISLDSLGVGIALPAVGIPLIPLLIMLSSTTPVFTFVGLAFGARLGERYERGSELAAGIMLFCLAVLFAVERLRG